MKIHPHVEAERAQIVALCRRWQITELALFGSAVRGELRDDSDLDFMITFAADAEWSLFDFAQLQQECSELVGRRVDLVERGAIRNPFRQRTIMRDLTVLYAA